MHQVGVGVGRRGYRAEGENVGKDYELEQHLRDDVETYFENGNFLKSIMP